MDIGCLAAVLDVVEKGNHPSDIFLAVHVLERESRGNSGEHERVPKVRGVWRQAVRDAPA